MSFRPVESIGSFVAPSFWRASRVALSGRVLTVGAGIASSILLPLGLDQGAVGQFFLAQIAIAGLSILGQMGLSFSIPATVTEAASLADFGRAKRLALSMLVLAAVAGIVAAGLALLLLPYLGVGLSLDDRSRWLSAVPLIAATIPLTTLAAVLIELLRAAHVIRAAANLAAAGGIAVTCYLAWTLIVGHHATLSHVLLAGWAGSAGTVGIGGYLALRATRDWTGEPRKPVDLVTVVRRTLPNLFTTLVLFGLTQVDMLLLSYLGGNHDAAVYGIALRFSAVLLIPLGIANSALAPLAVHARSTGEQVKLREMTRALVLGASSLALVFFVCFAVAGHPLISFWNSSYVGAYWLTLILGIGQLIHACGGAAGVLLLIWKDEKRALAITLSTGLVTVFCCLIGYRYGGSYGLAAGAAIGNCIQTVCFVMRVRSRFSLDPSLWSVAGIKPS